MIKKRNLDPSVAALLASVGIVGEGEIFYVTTSTDSAFKTRAQTVLAQDDSHWAATLTAGIAKMTTLRNDVLIVSPQSHTQSATLTWALNCSAMVGMAHPGMMNLRSRIGHNANFDDLISITGYGNLFANLYIMHGRGNAANLTAIDMTGNRNVFSHVHVAGPLNATEGDEATYKLFHIKETTGGDGLEHYFNHCVFGADTVAWTDGDMFKISGTPRLVFEDCMFIARPDNAQVTFLDGTAGDGDGFIYFKNCSGLNLGTAMTVALGSTAWGTNTKIFMQDSNFLGCTDVIAAANEGKVIFGANVGNATDDLYGGLGIAADQS
jgi:hypothetical protein